MRCSSSADATVPTSRSANGQILVPYDFLAHAYSNLVFKASAVQGSIAPGADVSIYGTLKEYDVPIGGGRAAVWGRGAASGQQHVRHGPAGG